MNATGVATNTDSAVEMDTRPTNRNLLSKMASPQPTFETRPPGRARAGPADTVAPMTGATSPLQMGLPASPFAQSRSFIGGLTVGSASHDRVATSQPTMQRAEAWPLVLTSRLMCCVLSLNVDMESRSLRTCNCASAGRRISSLDSLLFPLLTFPHRDALCFP